MTWLACMRALPAVPSSDAHPVQPRPRLSGRSNRPPHARSHKPLLAHIRAEATRHRSTGALGPGRSASGRPELADGARRQGRSLSGRACKLLCEACAAGRVRGRRRRGRRCSGALSAGGDRGAGRSSAWPPARCARALRTRVVCRRAYSEWWAGLPREVALSRSEHHATVGNERCAGGRFARFARMRSKWLPRADSRADSAYFSA